MDIHDFDPNEPSLIENGIFGTPFTPDNARIVIIPAPWSVTVSYGDGAHEGPQGILEASRQVDLYHPSYGADAWKVGISMLPLSDWRDAHEEGVRLREMATQHISRITAGESTPLPKHIDTACEQFNARVRSTAHDLIEQGKLVGLVGGDHSTPLGLMQALAERNADFGILQIDAHCDLREAYEGFTYSHASIMWNAAKLTNVKKLVQVAVRDYSAGEYDVINESGGRICTFFDADIKERLYRGDTWHAIVEDILAALPQNIYVSFDIDGLDPALCPHTGTPVPGGLQFDEAVYLIKAVAQSGKKIIGFDLNEVNPSTEWDANVGARMLWNLALWAAHSNNIAP